MYVYVYRAIQGRSNEENGKWEMIARERCDSDSDSFWIGWQARYDT